MMTAVWGSSGTALRRPSSVSFMLLQNAASLAWTLVRVLPRPAPSLPAVTQRIALSSPGFLAFFSASFSGFSKTISRALLFLRMGRSAFGSLSKKSLFMRKSFVVASLLWAIMRVSTSRLVAVS